jgi:tetratricopeptide (TPR) repeat protein
LPRPENGPNIGDRTNIGNRTNINTGNQGDINVHNNSINNTNNFANNRNWNGGGNWNNWHGPYDHWHGQYGNWNGGSWNNFYHAPAAWYGTGVATGWLASPGDTYVYNNPFYVAPQPLAVGAAPVDVNYNYIDYSQPIPVPQQDEAVTYSDNASGYAYGPQTQSDGYPPSDAGTPAAPADAPAAADNGPSSPGAQLFESARNAFKSNDYDQALRQIDQAIKVQSSDPTLHEFRTLVLFAQGKYRDAAAGAYAVLSAGPGWTWETVRELYADPETYTRQLRQLEQYVRAHESASDGLFLLAYEYLVLNHVPSAIKELQKFEKLVPQDKLAPQLIAAFTPPAGAQASAEPPPGPK